MEEENLDTLKEHLLDSGHDSEDGSTTGSQQEALEPRRQEEKLTLQLDIEEGPNASTTDLPLDKGDESATTSSK